VRLESYLTSSGSIRQLTYNGHPGRIATVHDFRVGDDIIAITVLTRSDSFVGGVLEMVNEITFYVANLNTHDTGRDITKMQSCSGNCIPPNLDVKLNRTRCISTGFIRYFGVASSVIQPALSGALTTGFIRYFLHSRCTYGSPPATILCNSKVGRYKESEHHKIKDCPQTKARPR
jgi:hypothetical protein